MTNSATNIQAIIDVYCKKYPQEATHIHQETAFLKVASHPCSRSNTAGHITGSGIVIQDKKILLIKHRYILEWFQPGGHIDDGETPLAAAIRELTEETGWQTELIGEDLPIDIDIHLIPANPKKNEGEHFHVDFAYLLKPISQIPASDEEMAQWFEINSITAPRLRRVIDKYLSSQR
jgi:8-oxo-dGTP pyrophosphatase MutT (NUDIX family)